MAGNSIFECNHGNKSSKRIAGMSMIGCGTGGKMLLALYGAAVRLDGDFTLYDKLDGSMDTLIYAGGTLIGAGLFELMRKKV